RNPAAVAAASTRRRSRASARWCRRRVRAWGRARAAGTSAVRKAFVRTALRAGPIPRPVPAPVAFRQEPVGVTLVDPAFEALPGARADFGRLGGAVYQIEVPEKWNRRLVLFMHGWEELRPEAHVSAPDIRTDLILH